MKQQPCYINTQVMIDPSIDQSLHILIILHPSGFLCVTDAGHRGNKIKEMPWSFKINSLRNWMEISLENVNIWILELKGRPHFFSVDYTVPLVCQQNCQEFNSGPSNLKLIFLKEEKLCNLQNLENHTTKPL